MWKAKHTLENYLCFSRISHPLSYSINVKVFSTKKNVQIFLWKLISGWVWLGKQNYYNYHENEEFHVEIRVSTNAEELNFWNFRRQQAEIRYYNNCMKFWSWRREPHILGKAANNMAGRAPVPWPISGRPEALKT